MSNTPASASAIPSIDAMLDVLASQIGADTILELINVYDKNSGSQLAKIDAAFTKADHKTVKAEAHGMKSSSANMGAESLAAVCLKIESSAENLAAQDAGLRSMIEHLRRDRIEALRVMHAWAARQA